MRDFNIEDWADGIDIESNTIKRLRTEIRKLCRKIEKQQTTDCLLLKAVREHASKFKPAKKLKAPKYKATKEEAWLCLSDWQIGKVTSTYNSEIAVKRIQKMTEEVKKILIADKPAVLHIILQGDMVEGEDIFPGQPFEIDSTLYQQALKTAPELMAHVITELASVVKKVKVAGVHGNHGRSGRKNSGAARSSNWDLVSYEMTRLLCDNVGLGNTEWDLTTHWYVMQTVAGHGIMCIHGDQIGGGSPIPLAGIFKKAQGWRMNIPDWKYLSLGHFHTHASGVLNRDLYFFLSGSPESDNEFAAECLAQGGAAMQRLCFFTKEHGMVREHALCLE
jgi:hypothetical protein|tara:strand:- start:14475 stop:15476 length:1002 start_codon:yes stop_codon:yes gene_type:complete